MPVIKSGLDFTPFNRFLVNPETSHASAGQALNIKNAVAPHIPEVLILNIKEIIRDHSCLIGSTYTLTKEEQRICRFIAKSRDRSNRKSDVTDQKIGNQSSEDTALTGFSGEFAHCKLTNLFPDFTVHPRGYKTDTGDAMLLSKSVDVKTTRYTSGQLRVLTTKNKFDLFALMTGDFPQYCFRGYMVGNDLFQSERIVGQNYVAEQHELKDLSEIYLPLK